MTPRVSDVDAEAVVSEALDRHERRRREGSAYVSTLVGPPELALRRASRWAETRGRPVARATLDGGPKEAELVADLLRAVDLRAEAVGWLARRLDRSRDELAASLARKTPFERAAFLDGTIPRSSPSEGEALCRRILDTEESAASALPAEIARKKPAKVLSAFCDLMRAGRTPALLAEPRSIGELEAVADAFSRLALADPRLTALVAVAPALMGSYERSSPDSRAKALVRQGVVSVLGIDGVAAGERPGADSGGVAASLARIERDGATEELRARFAQAVEAVATGEAGVARSAAERFLFERLESLPETTGLFRLNRRLAFDFGPNRPIEADLCAESLSLVVEVDGYYHFNDPKSYRRDRRKDLELQKHGYLVARVLADDVVERLEEVLDLILDATASRRAAIKTAREAPRP